MIIKKTQVGNHINQLIRTIISINWDYNNNTYYISRAAFEADQLVLTIQTLSVIFYTFYFIGSQLFKY